MKLPTEPRLHMYTRALMQRNLTTGNVAEAFFRLWWAERFSDVRKIALGQHGYNPEGIVEGREKAEMLKRLPQSPDFALYGADERSSPKGHPLLGISINSQADLYTMANARSPVHCFSCGRAPRCYQAAVTTGDGYGNLWFNRYNITNDYRLFTELSGAPVVLVTIVASFPSTCQKAVADRYSEEAWALIHGRAAEVDPERMRRFTDYILLQSWKSRWRAPVIPPLLELARGSSHPAGPLVHRWRAGK